MEKSINKIRVTAIVMLSILLAPASPVKAQQKLSDIRVVVNDVRQEKDSIRAVLTIEVTGVSVAPREQVYLYPVIRSGINERPLPPVVISGRTQHKVKVRVERLSGVAESVFASYAVRPRKPLNEKIIYSATVPVENWMTDANVAMVQDLADCRGDFRHLSLEILTDHIALIGKPQRPVLYDLPIEIPVPAREQIKNRSVSGEAYIIYAVGNAEIKPALANNQNELDKIRHSIEDIRKLEGVTINSIAITSYASPEGTWQSNQSLSERRAASLTGWLQRNYDLHGITLTSRGMGEDWDGLTELVRIDAGMTTAEREYVLDVISTVGIFDGRENRIMQYAGGRTYRYMLQSLFPLLRRSAYHIDYSVPEYSIETIKEIYKTSPDMLSLYEFYLLANLFEPGSREFRDVVTTAAKMFPDEKLGRISMAMFSYLDNDIPAALESLRGMEDDPEAWLYFSSFHARNNELDKAEAYARRALEAGKPDAAKYIELIGKYKDDEELYQQKLKEWEEHGIKKM